MSCDYIDIYIIYNKIEYIVEIISIFIYHFIYILEEHTPNC